MLLSYDSFPPGSDLSVEVELDGVKICATAAEPSARARNIAVRAAAIRAVADCLIVIVSLIILIALLQLNRQPTLPVIIYPFIAIFVAAIYQMAWKLRIDRSMDAMQKACRQFTAISATSAELRIESEGPAGARSHRVAARDIADIRASQRTFQRWWESELLSLRLKLVDGRVLEVLAGRDRGELDAVGAMLRKVMGVPEKVVIL